MAGFEVTTEFSDGDNLLSINENRPLNPDYQGLVEPDSRVNLSGWFRVCRTSEEEAPLR